MVNTSLWSAGQHPVMSGLASTCLCVRALNKHRVGPFSPRAAPQAVHTGHVQRGSDFHQHWIRPQCNSKPTCKQQLVHPMGTHVKAEQGYVLPVVESHLQQSEVRLCQENLFPLIFFAVSLQFLLLTAVSHEKPSKQRVSCNHTILPGMPA